MPSSAASVVHAAGGRVRLHAPALYRDPTKGARVAECVRALPGVQRAEVSVLTGSVVIYVDRMVDEGELASEISACLAEGESRERTAGPPRAAISWHTRSASSSIEELGSSEAGLEREEARQRLSRYGRNALPRVEPRSELRIFVDQLATLPVAVLTAGAAVSLVTGAAAEAAAIMVIVAANGLIGYLTESHAQRTIRSLEQGAARAVAVIRRHGETSIDREELVLGDLLRLSPGVFVAADVRLLEVAGLTIDESPLTGESVPVHKRIEPIADRATPLAERTNMAYRGTLVTGGSGVGIVVATGAGTEMGRVQSLAEGTEAPETPLQAQLRQLGRQLVYLSSGVCAAVFAAGLLHGHRLVPLLETAISLAIAAVPEGLPTVAVTTLALGVARMRDHRVLVRELSTIETLGALEVICLDKTGTITENRMSVVACVAGTRPLAVRDGQFLDGEHVVAVGDGDALAQLLEVGVLCSDVELADGAVAAGSPTESALVEAALAAGVAATEVRRQNPLLRTRYRSESRGVMDTLHRTREGGRRWSAVKGRPSEVLARCDRIVHDGAVRPLERRERGLLESENERMAGRALRVLGLARGEVDGDGDDMPDDGWIWLGMVGIADPPRQGIAELLARFHRAGIETMMITGDQSSTAYAVGRAIGLGRDAERLEVLDSTHLEDIHPDVLCSMAERVHIFSRVTAAHKLAVVQALQRGGRVVAMTGDGINDSPALVAANVGVALGVAGTPAAREVSDVVLADDNLETLISAIEQGRTIYDDIKKAVHFVLATNLSEILLTFGAVALGFGQPLTAMQLLWINLLTDIFPELALAQEPPEDDVLTRSPRPADQPMFTRRDLGRIALEASTLTLGAGVAYGVGLSRYGEGPHAKTLAFSSLTCAQLLHAISARSERHSVFDPHRLGKNRYVPMTLALSFGLLLVATYVPPLRKLLGAARMRPFDWLVASGATIGPFVVNELVKLAFVPEVRSR